MTTKALAQVAVATALQDTGYTRWTAAEITLYLSEAELDLCQRCHLLTATATLATSATTPTYAFYTLPTDLIALRTVRYRGMPLEERPITDFAWRDWDTETGTEPINWMRFSLSEIRIWPYATTSQTITCDYSRMPLATMGTSPEIPAAWHNGLIYYAIARALQKNSASQDTPESQVWMGRYEAEVAKAMQAAPRPAVYVPYRSV